MLRRLGSPLAEETATGTALPIRGRTTSKGIKPTSKGAVSGAAVPRMVPSKCPRIGRSRTDSRQERPEIAD